MLFLTRLSSTPDYVTAVFGLTVPFSRCPVTSILYRWAAQLTTSLASLSKPAILLDEVDE